MVSPLLIFGYNLSAVFLEIFAPLICCVINYRVPISSEICIILF